MRASRGLIQASVTAAGGDREGTPVVVMEAMASGLPVDSAAKQSAAYSFRRETQCMSTDSTSAIGV